MANRKKCDPALQEYEDKAEEILSMASALPKSYQEKILKDLMLLKETEDREEHKPQSPSNVVRRSSRTPVKTEKVLALEKHYSKSRKRPVEEEEEQKKIDDKKSVKPSVTNNFVRNKKIKTEEMLIEPSNVVIKNEVIENLPNQSVPEVTAGHLNNENPEEGIESPVMESITSDPPTNNETTETQIKADSMEFNSTCQANGEDTVNQVVEIQETGVYHEIIEAFPIYTDVVTDDHYKAVEVTVVHEDEGELTNIESGIPPESAQETVVTMLETSHENSSPEMNDENTNSESIPTRRRKPKNGSEVSSYVCPDCQEIWPTRDLLRKHRLSHRKAYKCEFCGQTFKYKQAYEKHVNMHESGDIIKCPHCANVIIGKERLEKHIEEKHIKQENIKKKYHSCPQCSESFRSVPKMIAHQKEVHGKVSNQCPMCGRRFQYQDRYDRHMKEHQDGELTQCEHNSCIYHYKTPEEYATHVARVHFKDAPRPHMCHICSQSFTEVRYLKAHLKVHKKDKKFICENCMFEAHTMQALKAHLELKHSMTLAHVCDICGARLSSKIGLTDHLKRHYNQKDYSCEICSKTFVAKCQLMSHRKTHEPPEYVCSVCEKGFVTKYKLGFHMLTHSQVKQFQCSECSFKCNLKSNLYKHMERLHHKQHPDKFSRYKYVQKVQGETGNANEMGSLEIVDVCDKIPKGNIELQEAEEILQNGAYEVTEQTEAAEVLAQMQSGQTLIKLEQPEDLQVASEMRSNQEEIILEETPNTDEDENVIIDHVLHVEEGDIQYQSDETMYILQLEGTNDTLTLNAKDLETLTNTGANVIAVDTGTVLLNESEAIYEVEHNV